MESFKAKIIDPIGLHARPASITVMEASKFKSKIDIESNGKTGNLKSIMNVMALGIQQNDEVIIKADGEDEKAAIKAIELAMQKNKLI